MAKFKLKKPSKRQPARQRYKIEKKVREHNRKVRKEAKKNPNKGKKKIVQIPNICPFKEDILKEVEEMKKHKAEELERKRQEWKNVEKVPDTLENMMKRAEAQAKLDMKTVVNDRSEEKNQKLDQSFKQFHKEFAKVIEAADVILEVLDARDPLGTKNAHVEEAVRNAQGDKKLLLILNKADLIPREILDKWIIYLKRSYAVVPFKASTQNQSKKLGHRKMSKNQKGMQGSACIGAELLMHCLSNYCRNKDINTNLKVGVVGLPNVGKSSVINSMKRSKACNVGAVPGVTKKMQEVNLDSKIVLLDCPGIVFASGSDSTATLKNAIKVSSLEDPITPAKVILQKFAKNVMMELYDINEYHSPEQFLSLKAIRYGKFRRGGIPDLEAAARGLLTDWNSGKIKYYTLPPEDGKDVQIGAAVLSKEAEEFDINSLELMETNFTRPEDTVKSVLISNEPEVENMDEGEKPILDDKVIVTKPKKKKASEKVKKDEEMELEGNQKLNKLVKLKFKKEKKKKNRAEKVATQLSEEMNKIGIKTNDDYSFDEYIDA